jgi:hypothetical protein
MARRSSNSSESEEHVMIGFANILPQPNAANSGKMAALI